RRNPDANRRPCVPSDEKWWPGAGRYTESAPDVRDHVVADGAALARLDGVHGEDRIAGGEHPLGKALAGDEHLARLAIERHGLQTVRGRAGRGRDLDVDRAGARDMAGEGEDEQIDVGGEARALARGRIEGGLDAGHADARARRDETIAVRVRDHERDLLAQRADEPGEALGRRGARIAAEQVLVDGRGLRVPQLAGRARSGGLGEGEGALAGSPLPSRAATAARARGGMTRPSPADRPIDRPMSSAPRSSTKVASTTARARVSSRSRQASKRARSASA